MTDEAIMAYIRHEDGTVPMMAVTVFELRNGERGR